MQITNSQSISNKTHCWYSSGYCITV